MAQFLPALTPAIDENGNALPGAKWRFYSEGTTTPEALSGGAESATADSAGAFATLTLENSSNYRATLEDADGRVVYDISSAEPRFFHAGVKAAQNETAIAPGAVWSFYTTGTTTPQPVYADDALSVPLGPSVTADAAGRFPEIYLDDSVTYKAVLNIGATEIESIDPANSANQANYLADTTSGIQYGQSAFYDAGTDGDWFVDAVSGSDGNAGTSVGAAFATINAAITAADAVNDAQVIRIIGDGVKYREEINYIWNGTSPTSLKIAGYGSDRPIISGANSLTGWAACVSGDSSVVGSNWANIYKVTVTTTDYPAPDYHWTLMAENGSALDLCALRKTGRTVPDFFLDNNDQTISEADEVDLTFGLRSGTWYDTITHPSLLGSYTDSQLEQSVGAMYSYPNFVYFQKVTSVASQVLQLETQNYRPNNAGVDGAYALLNVLPAMAAGQWGYRDNGDGTTTFYCWPNDSANLTANMELAVRTRGLRIYHSLSNTPFEMENINFEMFAGTDSSGECGFSLDGVAALTGNTATIKECKFSLSGGDKMTQYKFQRQAITTENCTYQDIIGFGLQTSQKTDGTEPNVGSRIRNCLAKDTSQAGFRLFGQQQFVMTDVRALRTSAGGHANMINFYEGCDQCVVVNFQSGFTVSDITYTGYATIQDSSRIYFLHSVFSPAEDGRGYVDQTNETTPNQPTADIGGGIINCWVPDVQTRRGPTAGTNGITVGKAGAWDIYNTIAPNIEDNSLMGRGVLTRKGNVMTYTDAIVDPSETSTTVAALFEDAANYDWSAASGSILTTDTGEDCSSVITTLEGWFPSEDFRRDALGNTWNPASPRIGPFGSTWDAGVT
jgi:hypothetical protein